MNAKSAARNAKAAKQSNKSGRRPRKSAMRPTHGAHPATTSCGTTMQAPMKVVAQTPERTVKMLPIIGRRAALASWNSKMQPANTSRRRSPSTSLTRDAVAVVALFCRFASFVRMRVSANRAGAASAAVRKNTAWFEMR